MGNFLVIGKCFSIIVLEGHVRRQETHHGDVSEAIRANLLLDLGHGLQVAPGAQRVGAPHRDHHGVAALRPQLPLQLLPQLHAAHPCIFLLCHLRAGS